MSISNETSAPKPGPRQPYAYPGKRALDPADAIPGYWLSWHVRQRVAERDFTLRAVEDAPEHPEHCRAQTGKWLGREERQRGGLTVVINPMTREVITVLFRDRRQWQWHLARGGAA